MDLKSNRRSGGGEVGGEKKLGGQEEEESSKRRRRTGVRGGPVEGGLVRQHSHRMILSCNN